MLLINYSQALIKEWHPTKNTSILLNKITIGSGKRIWWKCDEGHEWEAILKNRIQGAGCPYCSGYLAIKGQTDLATLRPDLIESYDFSKNSLRPEALTIKSNKIVWWKCELNHQWEKSVNKRTEGYGCPYCSFQKILQGYNDLETLYPLIANEWDQDKNKILPSEIFGGTNKKYWWKCKHNHSYFESAAKRTRLNRGCPYCSGQRRVIGINDVVTTHPHILKQIHKTKNNHVNIEDYGYGSNKILWWQCEKGHEWESSIKNRLNSLTICPQCSLIGTSAVEQALFSLIQETFSSAKNRYKIINNNLKSGYSEVDIFLEVNKHKICIEYDGHRWHSDVKQEQVDTRKTIQLLKDGYIVIRVREMPLKHLQLSHKNYLSFNYKYGSSLETAKLEIVNFIRKRTII